MSPFSAPGTWPRKNRRLRNTGWSRRRPASVSVNCSVSSSAAAWLQSTQEIVLSWQ